LAQSFIGLRVCRKAYPIQKTEKRRIKRYRGDRTGSALAAMEVDIRAELGPTERRMLGPAAGVESR
jgi:hypothetical protein